MQDRGKQFRILFRRLTTGVTLIAADGTDGPTGMTVNSLTPVSLDPPLLLFCAALKSATAKRICEVGRFSVSILSERQEDVSVHHAGRPVVPATWRWRMTNAVPWIEGASATFLCRLAAEYPGGDHRILVGAIETMFGPPEAVAPLLYHGGQYARLPYADSAPFEQPGLDDFWWTG